MKTCFQQLLDSPRAAVLKEANPGIWPVLLWKLRRCVTPHNKRDRIDNSLARAMRAVAKEKRV